MSVLTITTDWRELAECRDSDPTLFFPVGSTGPAVDQIVAAKDSGVKTLADLKGKSLSVGAPKSGTELNARAIFAAAGMSYGDLGKTEYLPFAESVELIKNRQLDVTLQSAGLGVSSIRDLAT